MFYSDEILKIAQTGTANYLKTKVNVVLKPFLYQPIFSLKKQQFFHFPAMNTFNESLTAVCFKITPIMCH